MRWLTSLWTPDILPQGTSYELDIRTQQLIKSETEGAWKKMAKQIAHEVKNPLTPIKLSAERIEKKYPNPGQFVFLQLVLDATKKPLSRDEVESLVQSRQCLTGMQVVVAYYDDERSGCKDKTSNKGGCHICNQAKFNVYLNNVFIGEANLINADNETQKGQTGSGRGGSRQSTFTVSEKMAQSITQATVDAKKQKIPQGSVVFSIKGVSPNVHADVPWVKLTTGQGEVIFDRLAEGKEKWKRGATSIHNLIGPFNPCKKIT